MIRKKIIAVAIVITIIIIGLMYAISSTIILDNFQSLENIAAGQEVSRAIGVIDDDLVAQDVITRDWAFWDATYDFVADGNQRFIDDNLYDSVFPLIQMDVVIFVNDSGAIVYDKAYDLDRSTVIEVPGDLEAMIGPGSPLLVTDAGSNVSGILLLERGPLLLTARPILPNNCEGPVRGTLIFGRFLDEQQIGEITRTTRRPIAAYSIADAGMPPGYRSALASLQNGSGIAAQPVNSSSIMGYGLLNDIYGRPALVIGTTVPRDITAHGYSMLVYFMAIILVAFVLFCTLILFFSERIVVAPLTRLHRIVSAMGPDSLPSTRVPVEGNDELAGLARAMNGMLDRIEAGNALYRGIVEDQTDMIIRFRPDGTITFANGAFCRYFGTRSEDIIGGTISQLVPEIERAVTYNKLKALGPDCPIATQEIQYTGQEGEAHWAQLVIRGIFSGQKTPVEYQVVGRDITDLKNAEEALRKINQELEEHVARRTADLALTNEALRQEVAGHEQAEKELLEMKSRAELYLDLMGHDINNLNQIALGYLEMATSTLALEPGERDLLVTPKEALNNSSRLVRNVMKLQRARNRRSCSEVIDLGKLLGEVQAEYSSMPDQSVHINYLPTAGCLVKADDLLKELFSNLIHNAIKHNPNPAVIDITLVRDTDGGQKTYRVDIADNGPGIPDSLKRCLFNRDQPGQLNISGKGLGLYLVKVLAESYGGHVRVEDRVSGDPSRGSRFIVVLPAA